mmetsp:Transcript_108269/g.248287  ORF Transcript_108269/g.248287 Transcript_108269/m.248287 type:complete len:259 (-) Transcript_108269:26-802(-)
MHLYQVCRGMLGQVLEIVSNLKGRISSQCHVRRISRYLIASCFVFFFELSEAEMSEGEWKQLLKYRLLEPHEVEQLKRLHPLGVLSFHVQQWALEVSMDSLPNIEDRDDLMNALFDKVYHIRSCQHKVRDVLALPMPFQYFHIMSFMLLINLTLWSYALGMQDSLFAPVVYTFIQLVFLCMRELSAALSDPFGDDDVDFPINEWLAETAKVAILMLEDNFDPKATLSREKSLNTVMKANQRKRVENGYEELGQEEDDE